MLAVSLAAKTKDGAQHVQGKGFPISVGHRRRVRWVGGVARKRPGMDRKAGAIAGWLVITMVFLTPRGGSRSGKGSGPWLHSRRGMADPLRCSLRLDLRGPTGGIDVSRCHGDDKRRLDGREDQRCPA